MHRFFLVAALAAACGNPDTLVVGSISASADNPVVIFTDIRSAIHGVGTRTDQNGNIVAQSDVIIISDKANLCQAIKDKPDYFRHPPEKYLALIFFAPLDRVGTFVIGRDPGTLSEIIATNGPGGNLFPFLGVSGSYVAVTNFELNGGHANGSFNMVYQDSHPNSAFAYPFYGNYQTNWCEAIGSTVLP